MIQRCLHWLLMVVLVLAMAACAPAAAQPTATPAPTAAPTITPDAAQPLVLVLPAVYDQKTLIAANRHYSDVMKHMGWNVEFYTVQSYGGDNMEESYLPYIAKQLSSGTARADGFICMQYLTKEQEEPLSQAKANGQIYDCVVAAPQAVPEYWAKYKDQIAAGKYGLVLANRTSQLRYNDLVLVVRKDVLPLAAGPISADYDGLRALIAQVERTHPEKAYVQAYPQQLLSLWTRQQGYLELFSNTGIYARTDDPDAKPVVLEDIPGFTQFFEDIVALQARGLIQDLPYSESDNQSPDGGKTLGPAAALAYPYNLLYSDGMQNVSWKGYTAFPLMDGTPYADNVTDVAYSSSLSSLVLLQEMIIPARSRRAADAMAFIQWVYADRRNADAAIYGQEGQDYALQGERVAMLGGASSQYSWSMPPWQTWPGRYLFQYAAEQRISADAPDNAEALLGDHPAKPLAAPWLACMGEGEAWQRLMARNTTDLRQTAMFSLWDLMGTSGTAFNADQFLKELRAGATDSVLQPYLDVLAEARAAAAQH